MNDTVNTPPAIAKEAFTNAEAAVNRLVEIYTRNVHFISDSFRSVINEQSSSGRFRACYPEISLKVGTHARASSTLAYGFVSGAGTYTTTVTDPELFRDYLVEQLSLLLENHNTKIETGESCTPIPLHFALAKNMLLPSDMEKRLGIVLRDLFDVPELSTFDDTIANSNLQSNRPLPLAHFPAPRIDYSLHRLQHYTATSPEFFQKFVLFTNYQFYINEFITFANRMMDDPDSYYTAFVQPGNVYRSRVGSQEKENDTQTSGNVNPLPQMPAYHLIGPGGYGITIVNIGIGPSNAKMITDHIAVLRPNAWILLGHCAGLSNSQRLGDYVLAHAYVREDHVLDSDLPACVPLPALSEIQLALAQAVADVTGLSGIGLKSILRTGTVTTVDNRNWELRGYCEQIQQLAQSRAIALDMEAATISANGFRFRVPYGTLLCVSDKPLHGELKLASMASEFYRRQVKQHLMIGIRTMEILRAYPFEVLHSRKLRSFEDVAFR